MEELSNNNQDVNNLDFSQFREVNDKQLVYLKLALDWNQTHVRHSLAEQGVALNVLYKDPEFLVRMTVAIHGYKLKTLMCDENEIVRLVAKDIFENMQLTEAKEIIKGIIND